MIARRRLLGTAALGASGALIVSSCQLVGSDDPDHSGSSEKVGQKGDQSKPDEQPDPDLPLLGQLIETEQEMINAYRVTIDTYPGLPKWCRQQLRDHQQHLSALRDLAAAAEGSDAGEDSTPFPTPSTPDPPRNQNRAVLALRKREQVSAETRDEHLAEAHSGQLARLIASIAASDALHHDQMAKE